MQGRLIAFVIWVIIGVLFIVMGIYDFNSKKAKPFGFWANAEVAPIEDVKGYNCALGILWCVYGVLFTLIGLPLLDGQNSGLIIIPILGAMLISIAAMVAYCTSQQKVDTTLYFYTSFNEHNTPYTVLESDNSESMPDVLH